MKNWLKKKIVGKIRSLVEEMGFFQLNADVVELVKTKSEFDQRLDDCAASVKGITETLEKEKATLNEEKVELVRKVDDCVFSTKVATDKTDELKGEITVLHSEIAGFDQRLEDCAASVRGIMRTLEKEKATLNAEKSILVRKVEDFVSSSKSATVKTDEFKSEITVLHSEIAGFDQKLEDCAASVKGIMEQTADFERRLSILNKKVDDYSEINAKLELKIQELTETLERLSTAVSSSEGFKKWNDARAGERQVLTIKGVEFTFRYCPPGSFMMGIPDDQGQRAAMINGGFRYCPPGNFKTEIPDDLWQREVTISEGFWICEVPTTQAQWNAIGIKKSSECHFKGGRLPVENVSWLESDAFIKKLNELGVVPVGWRFELPTETQWEYACRAGSVGLTYGVPLDEAAWYCSNSGKKTHEVGVKSPNTWGIFDMLGNVWEWTSPKPILGAPYVLRGGSWNSVESNCHPAIRRLNDPMIRGASIGFRCVLVRR